MCLKPSVRFVDVSTFQHLNMKIRLRLHLSDETRTPNKTYQQNTNLNKLISINQKVFSLVTALQNMFGEIIIQKVND